MVYNIWNQWFEKDHTLIGAEKEQDKLDFTNSTITIIIIADFLEI